MFDKKIAKSAYDGANKEGISLKKIFMTMILLLVLFIIAGLIIYLRPALNKEGKVTEDKNNILNRLELYEKEGKSLNPEEKKEIFETLSDTKIQQYDFSREEKIKLLKALNN